MVLIDSSFVLASTFTAVTSGNWSSSTTWGGSAPSYEISTDHVVIPVGINVTMDNSVTFSGGLSELYVSGTLSSASNTFLTINNAASITGVGTINVDNIVLGVAASGN